jgi:ABC-type multidrug transport system ATPase subunit
MTDETPDAGDEATRERATLPASATPSATNAPRQPRGKRPAARGTTPRRRPTAPRTNEPGSADADATQAPDTHEGSDAAQAPDTQAPAARDTPDATPSAAEAVDGERAEPPVREPAKPARKPARRPSAKRPATQQPVVLRADGLVKHYGPVAAAESVALEVRKGSIFGVVGPNGAGKTTTLSMITGLLRPDAGSVTVLDHDVWSDPAAAKRMMGVLPDRLRLFDRLTGAQLLFYSATLHGLDGRTARERSADLAQAFGLGDALGRQVADYSVGMAKKIALAATLIHSPRVLVLDEPFESVDPVSATTITEILRRYVSGGGTVILSSHSMDLVQRTCDSVAIIVGGKVLASGTMAQVRGRKSLEDKFVELAGGRVVAESMEWLHSFSD